MSACPNCGHRLRLFDLGQTCPKCGVNMRFYGFDTNFYRDAKKAELSLARVNVKFRVLKTALIGSKLSIARLSCSLLPLLSMLIPSVNAKLSIPFSDTDIAVSALGLYNSFSDGSLNTIMTMMKAQTDGAAFTALFYAVCAVGATALFAVLTLLMSLLSFASIKKMSRALCCISGFGIICAVAAGVLANGFCRAVDASSGLMLSGSMFFGFAVSIVAFAVTFALNFAIAKKGLPIEFEEGDLERVEIYKKIRRGEIKIDDLPQPIVETAETRKITEEIEKQQQLYREKKAEREARAHEEV